jgi:hypothetical protein
MLGHISHRDARARSAGAALHNLPLFGELLAANHQKQNKSCRRLAAGHANAQTQKNRGKPEKKLLGLKRKHKQSLKGVSSGAQHIAMWLAVAWLI